MKLDSKGLEALKGAGTALATELRNIADRCKLDGRVGKSELETLRVSAETIESVADLVTLMHRFLRIQVASQALNGLLANGGARHPVEDAVQYANALLKELDKE